MKILVPFKDEDFLDDLRSAGADEFYYGFYDPRWSERFGEFCDINRMTGFKHIANPFDFEKAVEMTKRIKDIGGGAFLTLNANVYGKEQIAYVREHYLPALKEAGIDGIIASDLNLARAIVEEGLEPVASTMCAIYNSDIARVYRDAGFKRLIVPRDLSLEEINRIIKEVPDIQFEVFFMRNGCAFSDCYCLGTHRKGTGATCAFIRHHPKTFMTGIKDFGRRRLVDENNKLYNEDFHDHTCGLCALYDLNKSGVGSLKIVGRSDNPRGIIDDIHLIRDNIEVLDSSGSRKDYLKNMVLPGDSSRLCYSGLSCYYPEVRFGSGKKEVF